MEEDSIKDSGKSYFLTHSLSLEMGQKVNWDSSSIHVLYDDECASIHFY